MPAGRALDSALTPEAGREVGRLLLHFHTMLTISRPAASGPWPWHNRPRRGWRRRVPADPAGPAPPRLPYPCRRAPSRLRTDCSGPDGRGSPSRTRSRLRPGATPPGPRFRPAPDLSLGGARPRRSRPRAVEERCAPKGAARSGSGRPRRESPRWLPAFRLDPWGMWGLPARTGPPSICRPSRGPVSAA